MKLRQPKAEIFVPDGSDIQVALARTTDLGLCAHQDDLEILAYPGILNCFQVPDKWFTGVVVTNGSGSPRAGLYANYSDEEMMAVRKTEQKKAAFVGDYSAQLLMDYPSGSVKSSQDINVVEDLVDLLEVATPDVIWTHNLADKHDTHVGVVLRVIEALRKSKHKPSKVYGCEVWRDLDWLVAQDKLTFDVAGRDNLAEALLGVFDSQIAGGKRYDLATMGRRRAHATYSESHGTDDTTAVVFGMDLTPLVTNESLDTAVYADAYIQRLSQDVTSRISKLR